MDQRKRLELRRRAELRNIPQQKAGVEVLPGVGLIVQLANKSFFFCGLCNTDDLFLNSPPPLPFPAFPI